MPKKKQEIVTTRASNRLKARAAAAQEAANKALRAGKRPAVAARKAAVKLAKVVADAAKSVTARDRRANKRPSVVAADAAAEDGAKEAPAPPPPPKNEANKSSANALVAASGAIGNTRAVSAVKHNKLLVLDLNGLFIDRRIKRHVREGDDDVVCDEEELRAELRLDVDSIEAPTNSTNSKVVMEDAKVGNFYVYERPHMREFIEWVHTRFEVGVWSSANFRNTTSLVDYVWGEHKNKIAFVWGQERCTDVGIAPSSTSTRPMFLKELKQVWKLKRNTGLSQFNETNTLLIDDSPYKAIRNPAHTAIHPCGFTTDDRETDDLLSEHGALRKYLEQLSDAKSVPEFVKTTPWNGGKISEQHQRQIAHAHEACAIAAQKAKAKLFALRDPLEIDLDEELADPLEIDLDNL